MRKTLRAIGASLVLALASNLAAAEPAMSVLGRDITFPTAIEGMPKKLSDFAGLQVNTFTTHDGVKLSYWEAGQDQPLVVVPGWSANGAQYINVMYLLARHYHVYVLDPRNQGLSQKVDYGNRIARDSMDLREFGEHLGIQSATYVGHSMGSVILWSYIDRFGTSAMSKVAFVDEPISIYSHSDWSEQERLDFGLLPTDVPVMLLTVGHPGAENWAQKPRKAVAQVLSFA